MPMNLKDYPADWKRISLWVRETASWKCELCGAPNGVKVYRNEYGQFLQSAHPAGGYTKPVKIILTVHHVNFDRQDNRRVNLLALCQRCHLKLDQGEKMRKQAEKKVAGTLPMFPGSYIRLPADLVRKVHDGGDTLTRKDYTVIGKAIDAANREIMGIPPKARRSREKDDGTGMTKDEQAWIG